MNLLASTKFLHRNTGFVPEALGAVFAYWWEPGKGVMPNLRGNDGVCLEEPFHLIIRGLSLRKYAFKSLLFHDSSSCDARPSGKSLRTFHLAISHKKKPA